MDLELALLSLGFLAVCLWYVRAAARV